MRAFVRIAYLSAWLWLPCAVSAQDHDISGHWQMNVELDVGSANWRTWSTKTLIDGSAGRWAVEARDASGRVLARSEFVCP